PPGTVTPLSGRTAVLAAAGPAAPDACPVVPDVPMNAPQGTGNGGPTGLPGTDRPTPGRCPGGPGRRNRDGPRGEAEGAPNGATRPGNLFSPNPTADLVGAYGEEHGTDMSGRHRKPTNTGRTVAKFALTGAVLGVTGVE